MEWTAGLTGEDPLKGYAPNFRYLTQDNGSGTKSIGGGFQTGKHELYPFPFDVIQLNPWDEEKGVGLKQNPGWE